MVSTSDNLDSVLRDLRRAHHNVVFHLVLNDSGVPNFNSLDQSHNDHIDELNEMIRTGNMDVSGFLAASRSRMHVVWNEVCRMSYENPENNTATVRRWLEGGDDVAQAIAGVIVEWDLHL